MHAHLRFVLGTLLTRTIVIEAFGEASPACPDLLDQQYFEQNLNEMRDTIRKVTDAFSESGFDAAAQVLQDTYTRTAARVYVDGTYSTFKDRSPAKAPRCTMIKFQEGRYEPGSVVILVHPFLQVGYPCYVTIPAWLRRSKEQMVNSTEQYFFDLDTVKTEVASLSVQSSTSGPYSGSSAAYYALSGADLLFELQKKLTDDIQMICQVAKVDMKSELGLRLKATGAPTYCPFKLSDEAKEKQCDFYLDEINVPHPTTTAGWNAAGSASDLSHGADQFFYAGAKYTLHVPDNSAMNERKLSPDTYAPSCQPPN